MELRVWVDGTQRVVCGVKLTTTCQDIVFALAHATQQAGRFTMVERYRNMERLLSPTEQPLVSIQRLGEHMNEAEFILRRTSSELPLTNPTIQQPQPQLQQQPQTQQHSALNPPLCANHDESSQAGIPKNYPYDDLYSSINKKCTNQPPAVPAKPRVIRPIANLPVAQTHPVNNAQVNYHYLNQAPLNIYPNHLTPRNPSGYIDYMEAIASRNSVTQPLLSNSTYAQQAQHSQSNMFQHSFDQQHLYNVQQNGSSPVHISSTSNRYRYSLTNSQSHNINSEMRPASSMQNVTITSRLSDSNLVINRNPMNYRPQPSNMNHNALTRIGDCQENSSQTNLNANTSVSQIGLDMLKVIEEQKKVLINQKNELERLDNDREYWQSKQSSEEVELINRIETEIYQLEELWKENQTQIQKLENQDFEKELEELKSEQVKMEIELDLQKNKLMVREKDIVMYKNKIQQLESELANGESSDASETSSTCNAHIEETPSILTAPTKDSPRAKNGNSKPVQPGAPNGTNLVNGQTIKKEIKSSDDDTGEDSGGDASDDLNLSIADNKLRSAKDVAYVDKRGLISGIRSLKLDKSRALNRQLERSTESINSIPATSNLSFKEKNLTSKNILDKKMSAETNGENCDKTANNQYELLMTL